MNIHIILQMERLKHGAVILLHGVLSKRISAQILLIIAMFSMFLMQGTIPPINLQSIRLKRETYLFGGIGLILELLLP